MEKLGKHMDFCLKDKQAKTTIIFNFSTKLNEAPGKEKYCKTKKH